MPIVIVIAGFVVLFLALRSSNGSGGAALPGGTGTNSGMPDPGATRAQMVGSISAHLPANVQITPFSGTSNLSPGTSALRKSGANRNALRGVGKIVTTQRVPAPPTLKTTNPAVVPFSATGTRAFAASQGLAGTVRTTVGGGSGQKL